MIPTTDKLHMNDQGIADVRRIFPYNCRYGIVYDTRAYYVVFGGAKSEKPFAHREFGRAIHGTFFGYYFEMSLFTWKGYFVK